MKANYAYGHICIRFNYASDTQFQFNQYHSKIYDLICTLCMWKNIYILLDKLYNILMHATFSKYFPKSIFCKILIPRHSYKTCGIEILWNDFYIDII